CETRNDRWTVGGILESAKPPATTSPSLTALRRDVTRLMERVGFGIIHGSACAEAGAGDGIRMGQLMTSVSIGPVPFLFPKNGEAGRLRPQSASKPSPLLASPLGGDTMAPTGGIIGSASGFRRRFKCRAAPQF